MSIVCLLACKKNSTNIPETINELSQSLVYKTVATVPSPADSAKGRFNDSLAVSRKTSLNKPEDFNNINYVSSATTVSGFSLSYIDPNKSLPYFIVTNGALASVPREFELNKLYEQYVQTNGFSPVLLGASNGFDAMNYFVGNNLPPDADYPPMSKTYTKVVFNKKFKLPILPFRTDTALFASGQLVGYRIDYWKKSDTLKYRHRWDFTIDFTDLRIEK